ncbi:MAG: hypothetical protein BJ554DRAFT_5385 [Olpidium bornovanus]|uniref:Uncharacterized protein n=1 Tax=Olpidium bornovanus TaxID=278681 RepID=A0A8H8DLJ5_9FUNG|nr:MAG: hypothetical protein BJ554DRAFT_5385 [Olpidium bornovanus]
MKEEISWSFWGSLVASRLPTPLREAVKFDWRTGNVIQPWNWSRIKQSVGTRAHGWGGDLASLYLSKLENIEWDPSEGYLGFTQKALTYYIQWANAAGYPEKIRDGEQLQRNFLLRAVKNKLPELLAKDLPNPDKLTWREASTILDEAYKRHCEVGTPGIASPESAPGTRPPPLEGEEFRRFPEVFAKSDPRTRGVFADGDGDGDAFAASAAASERPRASHSSGRPEEEDEVPKQASGGPRKVGRVRRRLDRREEVAPWKAEREGERADEEVRKRGRDPDYYDNHYHRGGGDHRHHRVPRDLAAEVSPSRRARANGGRSVRLEKDGRGGVGRTDDGWWESRDEGRPRRRSAQNASSGLAEFARDDDGRGDVLEGRDGCGDDERRRSPYRQSFATGPKRQRRSDDEVGTSTVGTSRARTETASTVTARASGTLNGQTAVGFYDVDAAEKVGKRERRAARKNTSRHLFRGRGRKGGGTNRRYAYHGRTRYSPPPPSAPPGEQFPGKPLLYLDKSAKGRRWPC